MVHTKLKDVCVSTASMEEEEFEAYPLIRHFLLWAGDEFRAPITDGQRSEVGRVVSDNLGDEQADVEQS